MMFLIPHGRLVFDYYHDGEFTWADSPYTNSGMGSEEVAQAMEEATREHQQVWLVVSESELWDSRELVKEWFEDHGTLLDERSFARVDVYLYSFES